MAREVLSNGVINPDKYQADWYADLSNNWNLLNNLIGSAISSSEVDSKIATAIQELMIRTFQIVAELPATGTEGVMYLVLIPDTSKYTAYVWENNAYRELGVIQMTITIDDELSTTSENPAQNKVITNALNNKAPISHTHSASDITSGLATVATSGSYNDLSNKPTIPTVNNATLTIQKNGTNVQTFTANQSTNATANITIPTKTSDLTNDSGFITSDNTKIPLAGSNQISGSLIPSTDGTVNLGGPSYQWNNAYIKSLTINGVACGNILTHNASEFVNVTGNQTIAGIKTFSGNVIIQGSKKVICNLDNSFIELDGGTTWGKGGSIVLSGQDRSSYTNSVLIVSKSDTNTDILQYQNGELKPLSNNTNDPSLGSSTNKWKSFNGVEPSNLSLPSDTFITIDTTSFTWGSNFTFTPSVNGYLFISIGSSDGTRGLSLKTGRGEYYFTNQTGILRFTMPVYKGKLVTILAASTIAETIVPSFTLFPLQGNV